MKLYFEYAPLLEFMKTRQRKMRVEFYFPRKLGYENSIRIRWFFVENFLKVHVIKEFYSIRQIVSTWWNSNYHFFNKKNLNINIGTELLKIRIAILSKILKSEQVAKFLLSLSIVVLAWLIYANIIICALFTCFRPTFSFISLLLHTWRFSCYFVGYNRFFLEMSGLENLAWSCVLWKDNLLNSRFASKCSWFKYKACLRILYGILFGFLVL